MNSEERKAKRQAEREARAKKTAEVFTPPELVKEMLYKLPEEVWEAGKTFIDPACGNGNFLVEVLLRKKKKGYPVSLKNIYGVDIVETNIQECQIRLLKIVSRYFPKNTHHKYADYMLKAIEIVCTNIVLYDALTYDFEFDKPPTPEQCQIFLDKIIAHNLFDRVDVPGDPPM